MTQRITWEEMKQTYPDEWVAIINPEGDLERPYGDITGEILCHHADRKIFTQQLKEKASQKTVDLRFTGEIIPSSSFVPILWQILDTNS